MQQILSRDTEIDFAIAQVLGDFGSREERHLDTLETFQAPAIAAFRTRALDAEAGLAQALSGGFHETALGGNGQGYAAHPSTAFRRSV